MTEYYVSFEVAKLLKEKGFEYNPNESYWLIDADNKMYWVSSIGAYEYVDVPTESFQRPKNGYRLVTQAVAMKWLREVHNRIIVPDIRMGDPISGVISCYIVGIWYIPKNNGGAFCYTSPTPENGYSSYEEACEAGIKYCLENLI